MCFVTEGCAEKEDGNFGGKGAEESGEKWREIWQQRSRGGVGGREYLSGRHSNAVSINAPGHLLNQGG